MILTIHHETIYTYNDDVLLNPHIFNLVLQKRSYFKVISQSLNIDPHPAGINSLIDLENNAYYQAWFVGPTRHLKMTSNYVVETSDFNPFLFVVDQKFRKLDTIFDYGEERSNLLDVYLHQQIPAELKSFTLDLFYLSHDVVTFLNKINTYIYDHWTHTIRLEPGFQSPFTTFHEKKGACRDLAYMLMEMLRSVGLATRFVSGYAYNPLLSDEHTLHAWIDIYIPGAGWIGVDPSLGLFCDHHYFPLSTSFEPSNTLPVIGTYGGNISSDLYAYVEIKEYI